MTSPLDQLHSQLASQPGRQAGWQARGTPVKPAKPAKPAEPAKPAKPVSQPAKPASQQGSEPANQRTSEAYSQQAVEPTASHRASEPASQPASQTARRPDGQSPAIQQKWVVGLRLCAWHDASALACTHKCLADGLLMVSLSRSFGVASRC